MTKYFEIVDRMEPTVSTTTVLATLLYNTTEIHLVVVNACSAYSCATLKTGSTRRSQKAPQGRTLKRENLMKIQVISSNEEN